MQHTLSEAMVISIYVDYWIQGGEGSSLCMQGADNLAMRHSQQLETGKQIQVYSADMRRAVSLQFYPDGYELVEAEPTLISEGYSSHKASHCFHIQNPLRCVIC